MCWVLYVVLLRYLFSVKVEVLPIQWNLLVLDCSSSGKSDLETLSLQTCLNPPMFWTSEMLRLQLNGLGKVNFIWCMVPRLEVVTSRWTPLVYVLSTLLVLVL